MQFLDAYFHPSSTLSNLLGSTYRTVSRALIIFWSVILSFQHSWIYYLNKQQKIRVFWGLLVLLVFLISLDAQLLYSKFAISSLVVAALYELVRYILLIYGGIILFHMLLHLPSAGLYDRKVKQLHSLQSLSNTVNSEIDFDKQVKLITDLTVEVLENGAAWLLLYDEQTKSLSLASSKNLTKQDYELVSLDENFYLNNLLITTKHLQTIPNLQMESSFAEDVNPDNTSAADKHTANIFTTKTLQNTQPVTHSVRGSLLGIPMCTSQGHLVGLLFAKKHDEYGFDEDDKEILVSFVNQAAAALEKAKLVKESIEKERLQQEMAVAHRVQTSLLPQSIPQIHPHLLVDAYALPATEVGGDYYDIIRLNEHQLGIVIADVSGKGISAAFYMAEMKGIVQALAHIYPSPKDCIIHVNKVIFGNIERKSFITLIYGILDVRDWTFRFARAGHCSLMLGNKTTKEIQIVHTSGMGVGLASGKVFGKALEEGMVTLSPGQTLIMYTDGITDAFSATGVNFDEKRLMHTIRQHLSESPQTIRQAIFRDIQTFIQHHPQFDDMTLMLIQRAE